MGFRIVPERVLCGGNPARIIREIGEQVELRYRGWDEGTVTGP